MATALSTHHAGEKIQLTGDDMFSRLTDLTVRRLIGKRPLEVGANPIARAALASLGLIEVIRVHTGLALPLLWAPGEAEVGVIEVYPAATLLGRGLDADGYKKKAGQDARRRLVGELLKEVELPQREAVEAVDHALDAVLCLLAAADFLGGDVVQPASTDLAIVHREGWIWFRPEAE